MNRFLAGATAVQNARQLAQLVWFVQRAARRKISTSWLFVMDLLPAQDVCKLPANRYNVRDTQHGPRQCCASCEQTTAVLSPLARQKQHRQPAHKQRATCRASYTLAGSEAKRQAFNLSFRALCLIMHTYTSERTHLSHRVIERVCGPPRKARCGRLAGETQSVVLGATKSALFPMRHLRRCTDIWRGGRFVQRLYGWA